jgi:hypothetical protein
MGPKFNFENKFVFSSAVLSVSNLHPTIAATIGAFLAIYVSINRAFVSGFSDYSPLNHYKVFAD